MVQIYYVTDYTLSQNWVGYHHLYLCFKTNKQDDFGHSKPKYLSCFKNALGTLDTKAAADMWPSFDLERVKDLFFFNNELSQNTNSSFKERMLFSEKKTPARRMGNLYNLRLPQFAPAVVNKWDDYHEAAWSSMICWSCNMTSGRNM